MGFADAGGAKQQDVFRLREEPPRRELADTALVDRWLEFELELVECFHRREVRDLQPHRDPSALLGIHLLPKHGVEEVEVGRLRPRGVIEHRIEALRDVAESQLHQLLGDAGVDHGAHRAPPVMTAA